MDGDQGATEGPGAAAPGPDAPAENSERKQRGRPFTKGTSGNPRGKPPGARNHATKAAEASIAEHGPNALRKVFALAAGGDTVCLKMIVDRLMPVRRSAPITLDIKKITTAKSMTQAVGKLFDMVAAGELLLEDAERLVNMLEARRAFHETETLESRIAALEARRGEK